MTVAKKPRALTDNIRDAADAALDLNDEGESSVDVSYNRVGRFFASPFFLFFNIMPEVM